MTTNEKAKYILKQLKPLIIKWIEEKDHTLIIEIPKIKQWKQNGKLK